MRKILMAAGAVALGAGGFIAGWMAAPAPALAQAAKEQHGGRLEKPYDVWILLDEVKDPLELKGVAKWDIEKVGESSFLRLTTESGAFHYYSLDKTAAIKVVPGSAAPK